jgi:hypothetical protein
MQRRPDVANEDFVESSSEGDAGVPMVAWVPIDDETAARVVAVEVEGRPFPVEGARMLSDLVTVLDADPVFRAAGYRAGAISSPDPAAGAGHIQYLAIGGPGLRESDVAIVVSDPSAAVPVDEKERRGLLRRVGASASTYASRRTGWSHVKENAGTIRGLWGTAFGARSRATRARPLTFADFSPVELAEKQRWYRLTFWIYTAAIIGLLIYYLISTLWMGFDPLALIGMMVFGALFATLALRASYASWVIGQRAVKPLAVFLSDLNNIIPE